MATCTWRHFESIQEFIEECHGEEFRDRSSFSGESISETLKKAKNGDLRAVSEAEKIIDSIDSALDMTGLRSMWGAAPVGAFPNVPAFLGGDPDCMWLKQERQSPRGEINLVFCTCCSGGVNAKRAFQRNITILAATMALSRIRPVNLLYTTSYGTGDHTIKVRSNPMVLSEAAFLTTSVGFLRNLSFAWSSQKGWTGGWAHWLHSQTNNDVMDRCFRAELGLGADDIVIPAMHLDSERDILANPVKYINGLLDRYRS